MLLIPPEIIDGKIKFRNNDVFIEDGIVLTEEEEQAFIEYRERVRNTSIWDDE